jgi:SAM-dependent methyltransferase
VASAAHGWLDVRQRARLDRGLSRHRTDFTVYLAASEALAAGADPYEARSPRGWRYVYPPLLAILVSPLRALPVPDAALVFYAVSVAALVAAGLSLARAIGPGGTRATAIAFLLASPFVVQTLQRGQVTALLLATLAGSLLLLLRGRDVLAGLVLAFGASLRLTPLLPGLALAPVLLAGARRTGLSRALRFPAGLLAGLLLFLAVVPAAALGPARALDVTAAFVGGGTRVFAPAPGGADLERDYAITEHIFKNQGVRRVATEWAARATDAPRVDRAPVLPEGAARAVGAVTGAVAAVVLAGLLLFGWRAFRDRGSPSFRRAFALAALAPVFLGRYAWPTHYLCAIPFLAECLAGARAFHAGAAATFAGGTALFYAGHGEALRAFPDLGCLLLAAGGAALLFARRDRRERRDGQPALAPTPAYPDRAPWRRLHRALRWRHGRLDEVAALLPDRGRVVDLGCGEGLLAHACLRRSGAVSVFAVDHDEARLSRLRASLPAGRVEAARGSIESAPVPPCDGVALVDVLHYLDAPAQEACLRRAFHALRPGGVLVLRDPDAGAGLRFLWTRLHERVATTLRLTRARIGRYRTVGEWTDLLRAAGFEAQALPRGRPSAYADRVVVGRRPG